MKVCPWAGPTPTDEEVELSLRLSREQDVPLTRGQIASAVGTSMTATKPQVEEVLVEELEEVSWNVSVFEGSQMVVFDSEAALHPDSEPLSYWHSLSLNAPACAVRNLIGDIALSYRIWRGAMLNAMQSML